MLVEIGLPNVLFGRQRIGDPAESRSSKFRRQSCAWYKGLWGRSPWRVLTFFADLLFLRPTHVLFFDGGNQRDESFTGKRRAVLALRHTLRSQTAGNIVPCRFAGFQRPQGGQILAHYRHRPGQTSTPRALLGGTKGLTFGDVQFQKFEINPRHAPDIPGPP